MRKQHPPAAAAAFTPRERIKLHLPRVPLELIGLGILLVIVLVGIALKTVQLNGVGA